MKLKLPPSAKVILPTGAVVEYSAAELVSHMTRNGREFGQSGDLEKVRQGARLATAFTSGAGSTETGELDQADVTALREALKKPSVGWANLPVEIEVPTGRVDANGVVVTRKLSRFFRPSAIELLSLIEPLLA